LRSHRNRGSDGLLREAIAVFTTAFHEEAGYPLHSIAVRRLLVQDSPGPLPEGRFAVRRFRDLRFGLRINPPPASDIP
jgi:hypothetical protein